ncbi:MAG TPA: hypothetical protein V6D12_12155, partial [Candidatus Obscuribacterales bacterium]
SAISCILSKEVELIKFDAVFTCSPWGQLSGIMQPLTQASAQFTEVVSTVSFLLSSSERSADIVFKLIGKQAIAYLTAYFSNCNSMYCIQFGRTAPDSALTIL